MVKVETKKYIKVVMEMDLQEARYLHDTLGRSGANEIGYSIYVALGDALEKVGE